MPLPYVLDHINLWALDDDDGWSIVDSGLGDSATQQCWVALLETSAGQRQVKRVFVTHWHSDHVGMAGWLTHRFNAQLWMTQLEYLTGRLSAADSQTSVPDETLAFLTQAGWDAPSIEQYRARSHRFSMQTHPLPRHFRRLCDGEELRIGGRLWRVIVGSGHSPEHACLHCPDLKLLISGDQVLPRISSNVSVYPSEPDADPLRAWIESLAKLKREVPDDVLVLPAHNECFRGLHARLDELTSSQAKALVRLRQALSEPRRVVDLFSALFSRAIDAADTGLLSMATGEALACLNHLMARGEVTRRMADDGVARYALRQVGGPWLSARANAAGASR